MDIRIFDQLKRIFCLFVILASSSANAVLITFDELDENSFVDANGERIPLTNEYESQGVIFSGPAYIGGGVAGPSLGFEFIGKDLPTFVSFNLGASGIAIYIDVRGPGYRKSLNSSGAIVGMTDEQGTPFIPYELFSFSSPTGISSVELTSKAGVDLDNLTYTYPSISQVTEPSMFMLLFIGLLGLFGAHIKRKIVNRN